MILTKHSTRSINFDKLVEEKLLGQKIDELLLIVPTNRKIRFLKKELVSASLSKSSGSLNLDTIGTFASKMIFSTSFSDKIVSDAAAKVLLKQSFAETKLRYFSQYKADIPDGTIDRIRNVISDYKKHGITSERLLIEAEKLETSEKLKAEDIAEVYKAYNQKCISLGVKETGDIYHDISLLTPVEFETRFRKLYPTVNLILIDGFDEFTSPETTIINSLSNLTGCELYLRFDYYKSNEAIFSHLNKSYDKFLEKGFEKKEDASYTPTKEFRELIKQKLFRTNTKAKITKYEDSIAVIKAANRQKEVELISKEIKTLILEKGVAPHKICVVFNLIQQYSPYVRDIFKLNNIPFNLTDRYSLASFNPVIELISFLEILENDFYYKDIFRVLGGTLFNKEEIDSSNLLQTAVKLKLVGGYENWINKISDVSDSIERDKSGSGGVYRKLDLQKAVTDLMKLKQKLSPFSKDLTPGEFFKEIKHLIYERKLPLKLINSGEERKEENIKSVEVFLETVQELIELFVLEHGADKKQPLGFYLNNIRTAVKSARFNVKEKSNYGVMVTNLNEIRGLGFDYLFIAGLTDGDLPTRYSPEIFFSGEFVKSDMRHLTEERYHFYQSLCSWEKSLYLSYSEKEKKKELARSTFLTEFMQLFSVKTITDDAYVNVLYNNEDVLKTAGLQASGAEIEIIPAVCINKDEIKNDISFFSGRNIKTAEGFEGNGYIYNLLSDDEKADLEKRKNEVYSITQLETYAKCPFKFFIERVMNLNEIEEPKEDIEAFEMGSLIHDILYEFYKSAKETGTAIIGKTETESLKAFELLFEIAEKKIGQSGFHSPFSFYEKERIMGLDNNRSRSILRQFYDEERGRNAEFEPSFFEIAFGRASEEDASIKGFKVEGINIRGKIDRIDINKDDQKYKVVDYKLSGKKPTESELLRGLSLQLPLYMLAAAELLDEKTGNDYQPAAAEIYSLKPGKDFGSDPVRPPRAVLYDAADAEKKQVLIDYNNRLIETCKENIFGFVNSISTGEFHVSKHKDRENLVCKYCNHKSICRVEEIEEN